MNKQPETKYRQVTTNYQRTKSVFNILKKQNPKQNVSDQTASNEELNVSRENELSKQLVK